MENPRALEAQIREHFGPSIIDVIEDEVFVNDLDEFITLDEDFDAPLDWTWMLVQDGYVAGFCCDAGKLSVWTDCIDEDEFSFGFKPRDNGRRKKK